MSLLNLSGSLLTGIDGNEAPRADAPTWGGLLGVNARGGGTAYNAKPATKDDLKYLNFLLSRHDKIDAYCFAFINQCERVCASRGGVLHSNCAAGICHCGWDEQPIDIIPFPGRPDPIHPR